MKQLLFIISTLLAFTANAQNKTQQDKEAIKSMCGCYQVTFEYAETFAPDPAYKYHERHRSGGLEWIFVDEERKDKIVIQHLLVIDAATIIKHWRQDWLYQNTDLYQYSKDLNWKYLKLAKEQVKGQWTQKVYQVDDSPRYEATATWIHADGKHYWESQADAPLPRREFSTRSDYNVLRRGNKHILTDYGWLHEQDNTKIIRDGTKDRVLVMEKGLNRYKKVNDAACKAAMGWWKTNRAYWVDVRTVWDELLAAGKDLNFEKKINDKLLWERLFELEEESIKQNIANTPQSREAIRSVIKQYLKA
jgi:hypothetical protein